MVLPEGVGVPGRAEQVEEEGLVEFVVAYVLGVFACGRHGDLADEQPLVAVAGGVLLAHRPPVRQTSCTSGWFQASGLTESRVRSSASGSGGVGQFGVLVEAGGDVDAEAVDAPVEPEAQYVVEVSRRPRGCASSDRAARGVNMCRYHWPGVPSCSVTRLQAGPPNMECQLLGGSSPSGPRPSAKWKRARASLPGAAARASRNHGCSLEQWLGTMSRSSLMPEPAGVASSAGRTRRGRRRPGRRRGSRRRRSRGRAAARGRTG